MAEANSVSPTTSTVVETEEAKVEGTQSPALKLKLKKPKNDRGVKWEEGTIDNEHMGKKKSKCCCIYEKPKLFGESSDESGDDDCTNHCRGHKKKCYQHGKDGEHHEYSHDCPLARREEDKENNAETPSGHSDKGGSGSQAT